MSKKTSKSAAKAKPAKTKPAKSAAKAKSVNDGPVPVAGGKCVAAKLGHAVCECEKCAEGRRNP